MRINQLTFDNNNQSQAAFVICVILKITIEITDGLILYSSRTKRRIFEYSFSRQLKLLLADLAQHNLPATSCSHVSYNSQILMYKNKNWFCLRKFIFVTSIFDFDFTNQEILTKNLFFFLFRQPLQLKKMLKAERKIE